MPRIADLPPAKTSEPRDRLLETAAGLFYREGINSVGVDRIVSEANVTRATFYRHFAGKDDLVAAIIDAGARRLVGYAEHRMGMFDDPLDQVRAWARAVLSQGTDPQVAEPTRAMTWNRNALAADRETSARQAESLVWALLERPLTELGRPQPRQDAYLIGRLVFGVLTEVLWSDDTPASEELDFVIEFCLAAIADRPDRPT